MATNRCQRNKKLKTKNQYDQKQFSQLSQQLKFLSLLLTRKEQRKETEERRWGGGGERVPLVLFRPKLGFKSARNHLDLLVKMISGIFKTQ